MADTTKAFSFNTFGGADTSIFLMFGKDTSGGKQTIQVGNIAAIQGVIKVEGAPRYVMGEADPQELLLQKLMKYSILNLNLIIKLVVLLQNLQKCSTNMQINFPSLIL